MNIRKIIDSVFKRIFTISGFATSAVILLIIVFLFSEGAGLFNARIIEDGYVLAINKENPVNELNAVQIKEIFDGDITNWEKAGSFPKKNREPHAGWPHVYGRTIGQRI